jgi:Fe-S-cluster containining protein
MSFPAEGESERKPAGAAESLCVSCGLCCDGTFLDRGRVIEAGEAAPLSSYKNEFVTDENKLWFKIPCPHYDGHRCTIYTARFGVCRTYRCKLLRKVDSGNLGLEEAKRTVAKAKALIATAASHDERAKIRLERVRLRMELEAAVESASEEQRPALARRLLDFVALDWFIESHFHENQDAREESIE